LIKKLIIIFLLILSSCSGISFNAIKLIRDSYSSGVIDDDKLYSDKYSHLILNSRNLSAIFILESRTNSVDKWVGPNGEIIYTLNGLVIKTELIGDGYTLSSLNINEISKQGISDYLENQSLLSYLEVNLNNLRITFLDKSEFESSKCPKGVSYRRYFLDLRMSDKVKICYDLKGVPINNVQSIEPNMKYKITYNYLFDK
jgi:hypothetical protein